MIGGFITYYVEVIDTMIDKANPDIKMYYPLDLYIVVADEKEIPKAVAVIPLNDPCDPDCEILVIAREIEWYALVCGGTFVSDHVKKHNPQEIS